MIDFYELIDDYVEGKLDPDTRKQFEAELKNNREWQQAMENYPLARKISQSFIEIKTREQIRNLKSGKNFRLNLMRIAAILIVFLSLGYFYKWYADQQSMESENVFASLYIPPVKATSRAGLVLPSKLDSAIYYYDRAEFQIAEKLLSACLAEDPGSGLVLRYMAHLSIQEGQYKAAEKYFQDLIQSGDSEYLNEAYYNTMILAIRKNDKARAKVIYGNYFKGKEIIGKKEIRILEVWLE